MLRSAIIYQEAQRQITESICPDGQVAVVPYTEQTLNLANRLAPRCAVAGIEIALMKRRGEIIDVRVE